MNNAKNDNLEPGLGTRNFEMILRFSKFRENFRLHSGNQILKTSQNELDLNFAALFLRNLSLYQIQTTSHLQSENSCWIYQVLVASKIYAF